MKKVFISYAREDCEVARKLYDDLKAAGTEPWMDEENLLVSQKWKDGVRKAIRESDYFLALISSTAVEKKGYFQSELNKALKELGEMPPDEIYILPVRVDECIPKHEMLQDLHWADLFPSYESGLRKILMTIEHTRKASQPAAETPGPSERVNKEVRQGDTIIINAGGDVNFAKDRAKAQIVKGSKNSVVGDRENAPEMTEVASADSSAESGRQAVTNSLGMKFVFIPPGTLMMGSPEDEPERSDDETLHKVTLTRGFYMQTTTVTQGQWKAVMGNNPSILKEYGDNCSVERVSWDDAQAFIAKLSQSGSDGYRLPTEAEWEYACRAGTDTPFAFGKCLSTDQANYSGNYPLEGCPKGKYREKPVPVASFKPNAFGLYDMHGNVWEWCQDCYGDYPADAVGPDDGSDRVIRGGSWDSVAQYCRSAYRDWLDPAYRSYYLGFRLVLLPGQDV